MHDALFEHQMEWAGSTESRTVVRDSGDVIGLDTNKFMQALHSPALQERILKDVAACRRNRIFEAVPTFFINGEQAHIKLSMEDFVQVIEDHLRK